MEITLRERTADTVKIYFDKAQSPEIKKTLPQKAKSVKEAMADFEKTQLPGATSFGQTIYVNDMYVGDVWCYCMDPDGEPNCMISYCIFRTEFWSQGIATRAVALFLETIREKFSVATVGAFIYSDHAASLRVLRKNGFTILEEFVEEDLRSVYLQRNY